MRIRIAAVSLMVVAAVSAHGQAASLARSHPGTLKVVNQIPQANDLTAAQRAAATATTDRILAILRRDPALATPVGYSVVLRASARPRTPGDPPGIPFHSLIQGSVKYFEKTDNGGVQLGNGGWNFEIAVNDVGYDFEIDDVDAEVDRGPRVLGVDEGGLSTYRVSGNFRSHPIYGGNCTYLAHRNTAPVVPVTKERYLSMELLKLRGTATRHETQRADMGSSSTNDRLKEFLRGRPEREASNKKTLDALKTAGASAEQLRQTTETFKQVEAQQEAALRASTTDGTDKRMQDLVQSARTGESDRIAKAQAELDALSPSERRSPVAVIARGRGELTIGDMSDSTSLPLMQPNLSFYDATLGADAPQVIWICAYHFQGLEDRGYDRLADGPERLDEKAWNELRIRDVVRMRDQLDWTALNALIKP